MTDPQVNYTTLQRTLDEVLGDIGLPMTIHLLKGFVSKTRTTVRQQEKRKLITNFITGRTIEVFDLKEEEFTSSNQTEYRYARRACFHLLAKYTGSSATKIGAYFDYTERQIRYHWDRCEEMLSIPRQYQSFMACYREIETRTIDFIAKI